MLRSILTATALCAALALPAASQASDLPLVNLSIAHLKATKAVSACVGLTGCATAITRSLNATNKLTLRANVRMQAVGTPRCIAAAMRYVAVGRKELAAANRFVAVGGSTATRDAYFYAALNLDKTLMPLVKAC